MSRWDRLRAWTRRLRTTDASDDQYWFSRYAKSLVFLVLVLAAAGAYLAFTIPISVFPQTNFPRVVIGVDNGVMPIDQMMVTITRPTKESREQRAGIESRCAPSPAADRQRLTCSSTGTTKMVTDAATGRCGSVARAHADSRHGGHSDSTASVSPASPSSATA